VTKIDQQSGRDGQFSQDAHPIAGPYVSATEADVTQLRAWMAENVPEMLELYLQISPLTLLKSAV